MVAVLTAAMFMLAGCSASEAYEPELGSPALTPPAIAENGTLRVGVDTNNSPLAGKSGDRIIGMGVDIAAALGDKLGLHVEIVDTDGDAASAIDDDEIDIALGIDSTTTQTGYWLSQQYLPTGVALFELATSNQTTPTPDSHPKVAAQVSSKSAWAVNNVFGEESLDSTTDLATAFANLKAGRVDYVASDAIVGLYSANRADVDVKIVALLDTASGYCAMAKSDNTELQKAVSDALSDMVANGIIDVIENKWLGQTIDLTSLPKIESQGQSSTNVDASGEDAQDDAQEGGATDGAASSNTANQSDAASAQSGNSAANSTNSSNSTNSANTASGTATAA